MALMPSTSTAVDFVAREEFDFTIKEVAEGRAFADIDGLSYRNENGVVVHNHTAILGTTGHRVLATYSPLFLMVVRIRRMIRDHHWMLLQRIERDLHGFFELRIVALRHRLRIVFDFDVGRDTGVFHFPLSV